jgi:hypothetical protein
MRRRGGELKERVFLFRKTIKQLDSNMDSNSNTPK